MSDIKTHLKTIRDIDSAGYDRGRERAQALEHVAGAVADAMLEGRTAPVYCGVEGFFTTEGFDQAVAAQLVVRHETLIGQRAKLADRLEDKGVAYGPEAARILRAMNVAASPVFWINPSMAKPWDIEPAQGAVMELPAMPGWQVERTPDGGAKGICESGIKFFLNGQAYGGIDVQAADQLRRRVFLDEIDNTPFEKPAAPTTWELNKAAWERNRDALAQARAEEAALDHSVRSGFITPGGELHQTMSNDIARRIYDATAELGSNPKTEAITHLLPVDGCWVEMKVTRVEDEDTGPEYDTVSQNDIRVGDIVEYHWDGKVRRWEVLDVQEHLIPGIGPKRARLELIGEHNSSEVSVEFPLLEDPFILRPRS